MGVREAVDLYAVREALETLAVRLALERMTTPRILRLEREVEDLARASRNGDGGGVGRPGVRLHDLIVRASGNDTLYDAWQRILAKIIPYMWIEMLYADDAVQTVQDHRVLCRHLRARDAVAAEALLRSHIGRARENLVRVLTAQKVGVLAPSMAGARVRRRGAPDTSKRRGQGARAR
jgi:DNA-binding GntR family transcriptional regulator